MKLDYQTASDGHNTFSIFFNTSLNNSITSPNPMLTNTDNSFSDF